MRFVFYGEYINSYGDKKQVECDITTLYFYSFNDHMVIKIGRAILNTSLVTSP